MDVCLPFVDDDDANAELQQRLELLSQLQHISVAVPDLLLVIRQSALLSPSSALMACTCNPHECNRVTGQRWRRL